MSKKSERLLVHDFVRVNMGKLQHQKDLEEFQHPFLEMKKIRACWCLHCECVYPASLWNDLGWECPGLNCTGGALDVSPYRADFIFGEFMPLYPDKGQLGYLDKADNSERAAWGLSKKKS